ncbi:MAG: hypothetical protein H6R15_175 [Proteobacteria bacterium]|nr:hypothetical protein [Pseudomonadota bacterium]
MTDFRFPMAGGLFDSGRALFASAVTLPAEAKPLPASGSRRRKLWEIPHKYHCPLIGVCFACGELRRLMHKVMHVAPEASDFLLHTTAVSNCEERSRLAELLQKALEQRYQLTLRQFAMIKSENELRAAWQAAGQEDRDISAVLWACWTHPYCGEQLAKDIYGDLHMLQHQLGARTRREQQVMTTLQVQNVELQKRLAAALAETVERQQKRAAQAAEAGQTIAQLRAELIAKEAWAANLTRASTALREAIPDLETRQLLTQRLAEAEGRVKAARQQVEEQNAELVRLRDFAKYAEQTIAALTREDETLEAIPDGQLAGKCVLCVGGRSGAVNSYREVVEQSGGHFLHHDGGQEESLHRIDSALAAADIVICQAGCISHNAYWRVKEQCKRTGKPCMFVKNSGVTSFGRAVGGIAKS